MMRPGNIITMWNQYTESTGGEICTRNKDKTLTWTNIKDNNLTL